LEFEKPEEAWFCESNNEKLCGKRKRGRPKKVIDVEEEKIVLEKVVKKNKGGRL